MTFISLTDATMEEDQSIVHRTSTVENKQEIQQGNPAEPTRELDGDYRTKEERNPEGQLFSLNENGHLDQKELPILTVEAATPLPTPQTPDINNNNNNNDNDNDTDKVTKSHLSVGIREEEDEDADELSDEGGEEEEVEEEEEEPEMTLEEKKDMHECVKSGDIDSLEDCLDLPHSDINMTLFRENLLMTAIRYGQKEMAEFLLDNGIDHTFTTSIVGMRDTAKGKVLERYQLNCRQMAYDKEMNDIVELIDSLQGKLFPFVRLPERMPRFRRPKPPTPTISETGSDESSSEGADVSSDGEPLTKDEESAEDREAKKLRKKQRKKKKKAVTDGASADGELAERAGEDEGDGERDKTLGACSGADVDSGHHSLGSSKLKMALLKEHDRLMEKEERDEEERERRNRSLESSSKRGGSNKAKETAAEDTKAKSDSVKSRTQSGRKSEVLGDGEGSETGELNRTQDEGYCGSTSLHSGIPDQPPQQMRSPELVRPWDAAPKNRIRSTKSALTVGRARNLRYGRRVLSGTHSLPSRHPDSGCSSSIPINFEEEAKTDVTNLPLRWRKVSTVGSYARESRQWHHLQPGENEEASSVTSVEISEIKLGFPSSLSHVSAAPAASSDSSVTSKAALLPRSIAKSNAQATTSSTSIGLDRLSSTSATDMISTDGRPSKAVSQVGLFSTTPVAGYMRATKSTAIKCRLTPRFASTYGALDFQSSETKASSAYTVTVSAVSRVSRAGKKSSVPVVANAFSEHQKRNRVAISFRS